MIPQILWFIVLGFVGGFTYILVEKAQKWEDLTTFSSVKRYVLGGIVGGLYWIAYSEYNYPNMLMTFVSGYMGTSFIEALVKRLSPEE